MPDDLRHQRVSQLFLAASELPAAERSDFLSSECAGDKELQQEVEDMLARDGAVSTFGWQPPVRIGAAYVAPAQVGPYRILKQLGEGGMGVVYLAEQSQPVRRRVALKIVKHGLIDSQQVLTRFDVERQALALMDHPNIAKVLDAGVTDDGLPYFAMEHVAGVSVTEHCDTHKLGIESRLKLFATICDAIYHAHQKGVIHRDIKPSNVLVQFVEGEGIPKVIDFGVAKATAQPLTEKTLFTEYGQLIGTPEYMSPEQAEHTGQDIDTRTDVYSLGVVLYQLLTGSVPFDQKTLRSAAFVEIQRIIREMEPDKPSTRLSSLKVDESRVVARERRTDTGALLREVRGDLDWIVMKALEKDRTRRYGSASDFAADIRRHLEHRPVQASPPSVAYRCQKFVRRNRVLVTAASFITTALIVGAAGTTWQAVRATRAEHHVRTQRDLAIQLMNDFILDFEDEIEKLPGSLASRELLLESSTRFLDKFASQAESDVALQLILSQAYQRLGDALGGAQSGNLGQTDAAREAFQKSLALLDQLRERDADDTGVLRRSASVHISLGKLDLQERRHEAATGHFEQCLGLARRAGDSSLEATALLELATIDKRSGDLESAHKRLETSLNLHRRLRASSDADSNDTRSVAVVLLHLADLYFELGYRDKASSTLDESISLRQRLLLANPNSARFQRDVLTARQMLANHLLHRRDAKSAVEQLKICLKIGQALSQDSPTDMRLKADIARLQRQFGDALAQQRDRVAAVDRYRAARAYAEEVIAIDPVDRSMRELVAQMHAKVGSNLVLLDRRDEAREELHSAIKLYQELLDEAPDSFDLQLRILTPMNYLAEAHYRAGDIDAAIRWIRQTIERVPADLDERSEAESKILAATRQSLLDDLRRYEERTTSLRGAESK